ncbi:hypothetical protein MKEN_00863800 [Mycena kentingensis (nom. inval.)]|nr:hypothetical protein MKEN_00863800 [Mycena kentingensis (nom. inval.)]
MSEFCLRGGCLWCSCPSLRWPRIISPQATRDPTTAVPSSSLEHPRRSCLASVSSLMSTSYPTFTPAQAVLIGMILSAALYGLSIPMFFATLYTLLKRRQWREVHHAMVAVALVLFVSNTVCFFLSVVRVIMAFLGPGTQFAGGPSAWLSHPPGPLDAARSRLMLIQTTRSSLILMETLIADAVVIYRCYVVWRRAWIVVLPVLLWFGLLVSGSAVIDQLALVHIKQPEASTRRGYETTFMVCTLSCNVLATGLLAFRLYQVDANASSTRLGKGRIIPVLLIILDAGALYSSTLICAIIATILRHPLQLFTLEILPAVIAIAFYMVLVRVGMARNLKGSSTSTATTDTSYGPGMQFAHGHHTASTVRSSLASRHDSVAKPVSIHVQVERNRSSAPLSEILCVEGARRC